MDGYNSRSLSACMSPAPLSRCAMELLEDPALSGRQQKNLPHWRVLKSTKRGSAGAQRGMNEHEFKLVNDLNEMHRKIGRLQCYIKYFYVVSGSHLYYFCIVSFFSFCGSKKKCDIYVSLGNISGMQDWCHIYIANILGLFILTQVAIVTAPLFHDRDGTRTSLPKVVVLSCQ